MGKTCAKPLGQGQADYGSKAEADAAAERKKHRRMESARRVKAKWKEDDEAKRKRKADIKHGRVKTKTAFDDWDPVPETVKQQVKGGTCEWLFCCRETGEDGQPLIKRPSEGTLKKRTERESARKHRRTQSARNVKARWKEEREAQLADKKAGIRKGERPFGDEPVKCGCGPVYCVVDDDDKNVARFVETQSEAARSRRSLMSQGGSIRSGIITPNAMASPTANLGPHKIRTPHKRQGTNNSVIVYEDATGGSWVPEAGKQDEAGFFEKAGSQNGRNQEMNM